MTSKSRNILGWILASLLSLALLASAADKVSGSDHSLQMGSSFGLAADYYRLLGLIEAASVLLFFFPRTSVLGTLLLSSYLGGAIATHMQHQQGFLFPAVLEALVWITAIIRSPELLERILGKRPSINGA